MMALTDSERHGIETMSQWIFAVGRDLFPRGYVTDVYGWERNGTTRFAWVIPPEKMARLLTPLDMQFRGRHTEYVVNRHGGNGNIYKNVGDMYAFDFLQRFRDVLEWPPTSLDENGHPPDTEITFIPAPGYPWPAEGKEFYSAKRRRWEASERPDWLLPEAIVDEGRDINSPGVDLCKLFGTEFGHRVGAVTARYGANPNDIFMVTHTTGQVGDLDSDVRWKERTAGVKRCGGLLFPSVAIGPVPATNFGFFVLIADVGIILNALSPYRTRGPVSAHVYSSDAWTGRSATFLKDAAISAFEQLHGHADYMSTFDNTVWQLGPDPEAPELSGPGVAERLHTVAALKRELKQRFRVWRRTLDPAGIIKVRANEWDTKAHYGYLEAKITGVVPMREFPVAVAPKGYAKGFRRYLTATGFVGDLIEAEIPDEIFALVTDDEALSAAAMELFGDASYDYRLVVEAWARLQYGWHILDVVVERYGSMQP